MTPLTKNELKEAVCTFKKCGGNIERMARELRLSRSAVQNRLQRAEYLGFLVKSDTNSMQTTMAATRHALRFKELEQKVKHLTDQNRMLAEASMTGERMKSLIHEVKQYQPIPPKWMHEKHSPGVTGTPILMGSDWHWGETVVAAQMNGVNSFNQRLAEYRASQFFSKPIELLLHHMAHPKYDRFILPLLGDMLSGSIHEELAETNWAPVTVCLMDLVSILVTGIELLLKKFSKLYIPCVVGNHGRTTKKMRFKNRAYENYEWVLYHILARHFAGNDAIHFEIADSAHLPFDAYDTRFMASHGDEFKGGGGISGSWSPIMRGDAKQRKQAMSTNRAYHYRIIGHWHYAQELPGLICNGSLKGYDEYAAGLGFDFQVPTQQLFIVHPDHGVTAKWPVYLAKQGQKFEKEVT